MSENFGLQLISFDSEAAILWLVLVFLNTLMHHVFLLISWKDAVLKSSIVQ